MNAACMGFGLFLLPLASGQGTKACTRTLTEMTGKGIN